METKVVEIRNRGTTIVALAIKIAPPFTNEQERWGLGYAGYDLEHPYILLAQIAGGEGKITCDAYDWMSSRTMHHTHLWLEEHFDEIESGAVVDVQYILGETAAPRVSDRFYGLGTR